MIKLKKSKEEKYISKRRCDAFKESIPYYICRIFPIKKNRIVVWTFEGLGGYADSPKYIVEEILRIDKEKGTKHEICWLTNDITKEFPDDITVIRNTKWKKAFYLTTASWWISNTRTIYGTKKRKGTKYLLTWHAIHGIKPIGKFRGDKLPKIAQICSEADSKMVDYVISGNERRHMELPDGLFYYGKIIKTGSPRVDILLNGRTAMRQRYIEKYNLPENAHFVLYAPTFRGGSQKGDRSVQAGITTLNFDAMINKLNERFGGDWYVLLRLHPQVAAVLDKMPVESENPRLIDVSQLPDMAEIQAASDVLITDYSSSMFESLVIDQPVFLFVEDYEQYVKDRGELRFKLEELPFAFAKNNDELLSGIQIFDNDKYKAECKALRDELDFYEDGKASERIAHLVVDGIVSEAR